ncbi:MAG: hypothetical protein GX605_07050, partial [Chloroflexi bacterium]|nr:hypothetical protein [Chloroflexota bacterium]
MHTALLAAGPWALLLGLAAAGWAALQRLRVPAAAVLGPMVFVATAAIAGLPQPAIPEGPKLALQVAIGLFAGVSLNRETAANVRSIGWLLAYVTGWTVGSAMLIGLGLSLLSDVSLATALLGASPGGLPEMTAMAVTVDADTPTVAVMHSVRYFTLLAIIPFLVKRGNPAAPPAQQSHSAAPRQASSARSDGAGGRLGFRFRPEDPRP